MNYCKPTINKDGILNIKEGRHPVIEKMLSSGEFVSNDTYLDTDQNRLAIITGSIATHGASPNLDLVLIYNALTSCICSGF